MTAPVLHHAGGDGEPIVLLHGFASDRMSWLANRGELARAFAVHSMDLPGHGDAAPTETGRLDEMVLAVSRAIDDAGIGGAHLVAHSLGGAVAIALAATRPDLVRSLALIAPAGLEGEVDPTFLSDFTSAETPEEVERVLHRLVSRPRLINRHMVARVVQQLADPAYRAGLVAVSDELGRIEAVVRPHVDVVEASSLPRLVIWGDEDRIAPMDGSRLDRFGGERLVVPGAAHMPHVEDARAVNERLAAFISTVAGVEASNTSR